MCASRSWHIGPMALAQANMITQCQYDLEAHLDHIIMATYRGGGHVYYMFMSGSLRRGDVNDVIYDADAAREGRYGFT